MAKARSCFFVTQPKAEKKLFWSSIRAAASEHNSNPKNIVMISNSNKGDGERRVRLKDAKIAVPPRVCTLRVFGENGDGNVVQLDADSFTNFFKTLVHSVDHDAKFKDWEIFSGRLAMIVFAATINVEILTGNSIFHKVDPQKICEFGGVCILSILGAASFAWASHARNQVSSIFSDQCIKFVDSVIDQLIDGLFYEEDEVMEEEDIHFHTK